MPTVISDAKWKRLIMHLEKVEEETGNKLRKTPRYDLTDCPIENFAPGRVKSRRFDYVTTGGSLAYECLGLFSKKLRFDIYEQEDSSWWSGLPSETKEEVNKAVAQWIKTRKEV